ncbi:uncharacterized protein I206_101857 [Kwoniella pini CBS 10737]|uniref:F-box domain-containing protein n=1 Tax=Kwoniella pini CBS 10737 TaxID=1296096 RepID=A0A1B9HVH3_9TREE|nr:uncharacterized protein I206_07052 [Kwoniella pini CBS 10737]OCF47274.1 hypothetical protein I206_07052 [Kwoniella pini CBS 10737]
MPVTRSGKSSTPKKPKHLIKPSTYVFDPSRITLPNEIIIRVLSILADDRKQKSLAKCCQVSKQFYAMSSPLLWNHLRLTPWKTDEGGKLIEDPSKYRCGALKTQQKNGKALKNDVNTFSLYHHSMSWCKSDTKSTLQLPNAQTLHLYPKRITAMHSDPWYATPPCRLLKNVQPKELILHNVSIVHQDLMVDINCQKLFETVEVLVLITNALYSDWHWESPKPPWVPHLRQVYYVFEPIPNPYPYDLEEEENLRYLINDIMWNLKHQLRRATVTFVNLEALEYASRGSLAAGEPRLKTKFERLLFAMIDDFPSSSRFSTKEEREERKRTVRIITLQEFYQEDGWWRYVDRQDMDEWVKIMQSNTQEAVEEREQQLRH